MKLSRIFLFAAMLLPGVASAVKFGASVSVASGTAECVDCNGSGSDFDLDVDTQAIGFTLETGDNKSIFSYKLNLSVLSGDVSVDGFSESDDISGFSLDNTFKFRVAGNNAFKFSVGPVVTLAGFDIGSSSDNVSGVQFGIGPVASFNWGQGPIGFALDVIARYSAIAIDFGGFDEDYEMFDFGLRGSLLFGR